MTYRAHPRVRVGLKCFVSVAVIKGVTVYLRLTISRKLVGPGQVDQSRLMIFN